MYNNSYLVDDKIICGTRGWTLNNDEENDKRLKREQIRLELSLKDGIKKYGSINNFPIVCMHYPPTNEYLMSKSGFIKLMKEYNVKKCIYGHLHGEAHNEAIQGVIDGIDLQLVSCDYTNFKLVKVI